MSWGPNDLFVFFVISYFFDSVIRDYTLNFHAKRLSMLRSHSHVTYSIGFFYFNIYGVEFYAGYNHTKIIPGPNDFYAFLCYFFDTVIRDYALNFHAKWLSMTMLWSHSLVTYSIGIFYFNIYGIEFYVGYPRADSTKRCARVLIPPGEMKALVKSKVHQ